MDLENTKVKIQEELGEEITQINPISGGCSFPSYVATTVNNQWFIKTSRSSTEAFRQEATGLKQLSQAYPYTPEVRSFGSHFLILKHIPKSQAQTEFWQSLGQSLAELHKKPKEFYGFFENNAIGAADQINLSHDKQKNDWPLFFWQNRIEYKLNQVNKKHSFSLSSTASNNLEKKVRKGLEDKKIFPSLVHGDLWNGNILCSSEQKPYLIDPAVYYGDRETDLAMTECFGGFSPLFYESYNKHFPLEKGYEQRKHIYNLYHMLNHWLIFGDSYRETCLKIIQSL